MSDEQTPQDETTAETPEAVAEAAPVVEGQAEVAEVATHDHDAVAKNLGVILDLDLPLTVRFGKTSATLGSLVRLAPGSMVGLDRAPTDPVEVLVNGKVIARGDVVSVAGNYGVRITDIVSPSERIPELGG